MMQNGRWDCGNVSMADAGKEIHLAGWVDALRDHGEVLFMHLRDRSGIVQVVFSPEFTPPEVCERARALRSEYCVALNGRVAERAPGTENPHIETGTLEVLVQDLSILSRAAALPFGISEKAMVAGGAGGGVDSVAEELRLQYRYLDLRRPSMQQNLAKRYRIIKTARDFLDEKGFLEIETPLLTKSTPEGARDYLVPSRHYPKHFYALPQSPQLFKQLLMVAGFERYFQVVRCFRDEDLRPNRQPEFTQLDLEASFIDEEFIYELVEELVSRMFAVGGVTLPRPFPRMTHRDAMDFYGTDRPDTRFALRFVEATDIFADTQYSIFKQILQRGGRIKGINVRGQSEKLSKNVLQNEYAKEIVPSFGAKGMTWMRVMDGGLESNIVQFFSEQERHAVLERFGAQDGDVILMIADSSYELVVSALGQLRLHLAERLGLVPSGVFAPLWVTDFPLFEATEDGVTSNHHPFTAPHREDFNPSDREGLLDLRSRAYDVVVNGEELGGGSIRINSKELQMKIFQALGLSREEIEEKFGFFVRALDYGAPPHGGLALGMDRVASMILGTSSIREVTAFPKNRSAYCPLTQAPSEVSLAQLEELGLLQLGEAKPIPGVQEQQELIETLSWVSRIGLETDERPAILSALADARKLAEIVESRAGREEPLFAPLPVANRMREKGPAVNSPLAAGGELLKNAPAVKGNYFKVASILD
ncbi:aspartate--tRNA ligase [Desulforhabdus sp. TSK]|uniref:aspartate--tRNA ligase n=1 Tax=Desulforhabdus sp. TSK TaxID=2925014 RepID=UPI001FC8BEB0|nr:aspartate--tRNA ligase [Desulforhabdus sp. TSK]GKT09440.1 aspartate--tRNA(Asp/Asn) ligase [Desulforhabdus sp. TSK]